MASKVNKLIELANKNGLDVLQFEFMDAYHIRVCYHHYAKAGTLPVEEFCRDKKDYELRMLAWRKAGTVYSPEYVDFDSMISGELKRLKYGR